MEALEKAKTEVLKLDLEVSSSPLSSFGLHLLREDEKNSS